MFRYLLVFVIGALLGANVAWYYAHRAAVPCVPTAAPSTVPSSTTPAGPAAGRTAPVTPTAPVPTPTPAAPGAATAPAVHASSGLIIPVAGIAPSQLVDTYTQSRSEGRTHDAIDIMAPAGTPVLAAVDGTVAKLFTSRLGGLTIYQFDPDGRLAYYYAHLQGYAPGVHEGTEVHRGDLIGYVGSTGNADAKVPHLHFTVFRLGTPAKWWEGEAVNPYPALVRAQPTTQVAQR